MFARKSLNSLVSKVRVLALAFSRILVCVCACACRVLLMYFPLSIAHFYYFCLPGNMTQVQRHTTSVASFNIETENCVGGYRLFALFCSQVQCFIPGICALCVWCTGKWEVGLSCWIKCLLVWEKKMGLHRYCTLFRLQGGVQNLVRETNC